MSRQPDSDPLDEQPTALACDRCQGREVFVAAFTWAGERQLQWHCQVCDAVWITPDRRSAERAQNTRQSAVLRNGSETS